MEAVSINQIRTGQITLDSSLGERSASPPTPQFEEAVELFKATGLPDDILFSAQTFWEFLTENPDARNLQSYKDTFSTASTNLDENLFLEIFQDFSLDQIERKGSFSPSEAFQDWGAYVKERNDTQNHMETVANNLADSATAGTQSKKAEESFTTSSSGSLTRKPVEDPLKNLGMLMKRMIAMFDTLSELGMVQAKELEMQTAIQEEYLNKQNALQPFDEGMDIWIKNSKGDKVDKDIMKSNMEKWNNIILPAQQERIRSLKEQASERAKQINAKINRTTQMTSSINDEFSNKIMQLTSAARAFFR